MRWQRQHLDQTDAAALPGLSRIPGLVRSVSTPEFDGVTFHEVLARSVLNKIPASSPMPFRWTINPYRGCTHACFYCLAGETPILLTSGATKPLAKIDVGDEVVGTVHRRGRRRRYTSSIVEAHWETIRPAVRVELADGHSLTASPEHRLLTRGGWQQTQHLASGDQLMGSSRLRRWPRHARNLSLTGRPVNSDSDLSVAAVHWLDAEARMYDITTSTGDFVADGVVSHNCYARSSHTWLDFDPGSGFDSQIVVKVNAAEVLAREVASSSHLCCPG